MQKLNSIQAYKEVSEGAGVSFIQDPALKGVGRIVKMRINTPKPVNLYVTALKEVDVDLDDGEIGIDYEADGEPSFLAHLEPGLDEIFFVYTGDFAVRAIGSDIWLDTYDASNFEVQPTDYDSYARVLEREEIDPRIAAVQYEIKKAQREFAAQRERDRIEYEARIAAIEAKAPENVTPPANPPAASETGATAGSPSVGEQGPDAAGGEAKGATGGQTNVGSTG